MRSRSKCAGLGSRVSCLLKTIGIVGSRKQLANMLGITPEILNAWLNRGVCVPLEYAIEIERITNGNMTWQEISPHLAHLQNDGQGLLSPIIFCMFRQ